MVSERVICRSVGLWNALTSQGKLALVAALVAGIIIFGLVYGSGDEPRSGLDPLVTPQLTAASPTPAQVLPIATAPLPASPTPAATALAPSPTAPAPTATSAVQAPTQAPVAPTATATTAASGCATEASVAAAPGNDTVTARLVCDGRVVTGAPMTALFTYQATNGRCTAVADPAGVASCRSSAGAAAGPLDSVDACFGHMGQLYCGAASP